MYKIYDACNNVFVKFVVYQYHKYVGKNNYMIIIILYVILYVIIICDNLFSS